MTQERIKALQNLGYDPEEARFLCIAALQSGFFLRRQFLSFIGGTKGWKDVVLLNKLKLNRHCRVTVYRHSRMVYHLSAKPLYEALGEKDNRNRREHQPSTIKNKIMGLDFVLEHPTYQYLATEQEKLDYFVRMLKIPPDDLPTRWYESPRRREATAKHFADKYPIFLSAAPVGTTAVLHFCYVDEGMQSIDRFETYLKQYSRLFRARPDFRVIYIAQDNRLLESAQRTFQRISRGWEAQAVLLDVHTRQELDYFEMRQEYEARDFARFDTARLIRYREAKKQFAGERYEALYTQWKAGGRAAVVGTLCPGQEFKEPPVERFSTYVLNHDYDLFGTLTSRSANPTVAGGVQTQP